ncbi:hypothetical protein ACTWP5_23880 [Streptomyces sp. 4N509B]|uniref:hypothetical protein n=1 Tax=Streptomyces sp. 4N509B TaxID=3457413 RepID=UPI003FD51AE0
MRQTRRTGRTGRRPRLWRLAVVPALVLSVGTGLTACGGGDGGDGDGNGDSGAFGAAGGGAGGGSRQDMAENVLAWYDCMRENGVDLPDPDPNNPAIRLPEGGANDPEVRAAQEACQDELPGGGPGNGEPLTAEQLDQMREFTACLRENGVDIADPDASGMLTMPEGIDPQGPEFQTAMGECQEFAAGLPMRFGPPGGGM